MISHDAHPPTRSHRVLVENFPNGILVLFDADFRYRIVAPETLPFSGRPASTLLGKTIYERFPAEHVAQLEPVFQDTIDGTPRSIDLEFENHAHHLETQPVEIDGEPYGVLVTQEVTEERETEAALERRNERLDQFASMMSHDLRNPLDVAVGRLALFRETGDPDHLDSLETALDRVDQLITDLTELTRRETSTAGYEPVSVSDLARAAWGMIDPPGSTLETTDCVVVGDQGKLQTLFENLFRNAVGHGGDDVTVRVGPLASGDGFFVEDTGRGIPPDERDRVFEHGFTTDSDDTGTGTGLTIVHRIASAHGFDVGLGESPEGGARFEFREPDAE